MFGWTISFKKKSHPWDFLTRLGVSKVDLWRAPGRPPHDISIIAWEQRAFVTCLISLMQMTAMLDCFPEMQITHLLSWVLHRTLALMQKIHTYRRAEWRPYGDWSLWHFAGSLWPLTFFISPVTLFLSPTKLVWNQCCRITMPTSTAWLWVEVERHLWSGAPSRMTNWQLRVTEGSGVILLNGSHGDEQQKTRIHLHI